MKKYLMMTKELGQRGLILVAMFPPMILGFSLFVAGCAKVGVNEPNMSSEEETEYMLALDFDTSSSFEQHLRGNDPKALKHAIAIKDAFFRERQGSDDRLVISQISSGRNVLWDGKSKSFKKRFTNPASFRDFLIQHSNGGSWIHASMADTIGYLVSEHERNPKLRTAAIFYTDMEENGEPKDKDRFITVLRQYAKHRGFVGIYFASLPLIPEYKKILTDSGVKFVIESDARVDPAVVSFN